MGSTDICAGSPTQKHIFNPPMGAFYDFAHPRRVYAIARCKYCGYNKNVYPDNITPSVLEPLSSNNIDYSNNIDFIMRTK